MVSETRIRQALYQKLNVAQLTGLLGSGSASLSHGPNENDAHYPLCQFDKNSGLTDMRAFGGDHAQNELWVVKGIAKTASQAEAVDKAAFDLLDFGDLTITGADDMYLARESDLSYPETQGDTVFWHVGGIYRLRHQDS